MSDSARAILGAHSLNGLDGRKIKLGQFYFTIRTAPSLKSDTGESLLGAHRHSLQELWINSDVKPSLFPAVLIHEIMHEMFVQTGRTSDEGIADAVAYFLSQVFADNPWLGVTLTVREEEQDATMVPERSHRSIETR